MTDWFCAGTKRSAEAPASRASKAAKTDAKDSPSNAKKGAAKKNGKVVSDVVDVARVALFPRPPSPS